MYRNILKSMEGISIWPVFGLIIFFIFFIVILIRVFKIDKNFIERMKNLPLDENDKPKYQLNMKTPVKINEE